jgi:hypothetical protein
LFGLRELFLRSVRRLHFGASLFNIFIDDLCDKIYFSEFMLFADDLKILSIIKPAEDCK